jgi:precorrin-6B methylase 2
MFKPNWQLNEDSTPFFIKYGYNWVFNGIPKNQRTEVMSQTWGFVKDNYDEDYFLNRVVHKDKWCKTTSRKFKEDVLRIFRDRKMDNCIEIGSCRGDTTRVLAECFKKVYSFEQSSDNITYIKERCSDVDNVEISQADVYDSNFEIPDVSVAFIDAGHSTELVKKDISRFLNKNPNMVLVFDDYGQKDESIKKAILDTGVKISRHIGEYNGFKFNRINGEEVTMIGREGVICNL